MAQLNFTQNGLAWISDEISVSSDFNLHIEREKAAQLNIMQKTSGEKWGDIIEAERYANKTVIDVDIQVLIPKKIKVISYSKVTSAEYTTA
jgi:hypothetical protein|nr:MAG TPA: hypothetical protein [Bacteriophage sp.]